ncbi:MAG: spondin domain-containing protein [Pseudomonadota bacterium]
MLPKTRRGLAASALAFCALLAGGTAHAATFDITVTNEAETGGLFLTPFLFVTHNGSFDAFDAGERSSGALQALAEEGDVSGLIGEAGAFSTGVGANPGGFGGPPVLDPGESATVRFSVDPDNERFLSFFSMIIPSNDTFIGNEDPMAYEIISDTGGVLAQTIEVFGNQAWDSGTEANDGSGAAFSSAGGARTDTPFETVQQAGDLSFLLGQPTVAGTTINQVPGAGQLLASIEIAPVPVPASLPLLAFGLGAMAFAARRKRS